MGRKQAARVTWRCPTCGNGVLGSKAPRKNNIVRYCLPCSAKAGKLIERVCPTLDRKREQKDTARKAKAERKREKAGPATRTTKRSWMRSDRFIFDGPEGAKFNIMEVAERMCSSKRWDRVVLDAVSKCGGARPRNGSRAAQALWRETMRHRGSLERHFGTLRVRRSSGGYVSGRGGPGYGVTIGAHTNQAHGEILWTLLHEITHFVHLRVASASRVNGKRRPHDLCFNLIQSGMAKRFWGYDFHPYEAGYSVGKGYAPSRHLDKWIREQIKAGNPRVTGWLGVLETELDTMLPKRVTLGDSESF